MISITQLEPAPGSDPHVRPRPSKPDGVEVEGVTKYVIERIVAKRVDKLGRKRQIKYLVRWEGWGPEDNTWESKEALIEDGAIADIEEFETHENPRAHQQDMEFVDDIANIVPDPDVD